MARRTRGETGHRAAEVYEQLFVPALFQQWGKVVTEAAAIGRGHRILDVACGTGALARAAAERVGLDGMVVGLDASEEMLAVARRNGAGIEWRKGQAEAIPCADESFDAVVSQFGLMFFEDRVAALREMKPVLRRAGRVALAVCDALEHCAGYAALAESLHQLFGEPIANAFRSPFVLGDPEQLLPLWAAAGIRNPNIMRHEGQVRFASIESLVSTERACAWTLGGLPDVRNSIDSSAPPGRSSGRSWEPTAPWLSPYRRSSLRPTRNERRPRCAGGLPQSRRTSSAWAPILTANRVFTTNSRNRQALPRPKSLN